MSSGYNRGYVKRGGGGGGRGRGGGDYYSQHQQYPSQSDHGYNNHHSTNGQRRKEEEGTCYTYNSASHHSHPHTRSTLGNQNAVAGASNTDYYSDQALNGASSSGDGHMNTNNSNKTPNDENGCGDFSSSSQVHTLQSVHEGQYVKVLTTGDNFELGTVVSVTPCNGSTYQQQQQHAGPSQNAGIAVSGTGASNNIFAKAFGIGAHYHSTHSNNATNGKNNNNNFGENDKVVVRVVAGYNITTTRSKLRRAFLVILDLNGVLGFRVNTVTDLSNTHESSRCTSPSGDIVAQESPLFERLSKMKVTLGEGLLGAAEAVSTSRTTAFVARPNLSKFLNYLFKNFIVGVWTSGEKKNTNTIIDFVFGPELNDNIDYRTRITFIFDREYTTPRPTPEKPFATVKDLEKVIFKDFEGSFNVNNTVIIDDSSEKCSHPDNALCPPAFGIDAVSHLFVRVHSSVANVGGGNFDALLYVPKIVATLSTSPHHGNTAENEATKQAYASAVDAGLLLSQTILGEVLSKDSLEPIRRFAMRSAEEAELKKTRQREAEIEVSRRSVEEMVMRQMMAGAIGGSTATKSLDDGNVMKFFSNSGTNNNTNNTSNSTQSAKPPGGIDLTTSQSILSLLKKSKGNDGEVNPHRAAKDTHATKFESSAAPTTVAPSAGTGVPAATSPQDANGENDDDDDEIVYNQDFNYSDDDDDDEGSEGPCFDDEEGTAFPSPPCRDTHLVLPEPERGRSCTTTTSSAPQLPPESSPAPLLVGAVDIGYTSKLKTFGKPLTIKKKVKNNKNSNINTTSVQQTKPTEGEKHNTSENVTAMPKKPKSPRRVVKSVISDVKKTDTNTATKAVPILQIKKRDKPQQVCGLAASETAARSLVPTTVEPTGPIPATVAASATPVPTGCVGVSPLVTAFRGGRGSRGGERGRGRGQGGGGRGAAQLN